MVPARFFVGDPDAPAPNQPRRLGVCVALWAAESNDVLLEYRSDSDYWAFIGGGVHDDESLMTAIRRETQEETGCAPDTVELVAVFSDPTRIVAYPDGNVSQIVTFAFQGELSSGSLVISQESRDLRFWPVSGLARLNIAPTHVDFARLIIERGRGSGPAPVAVD